MDSRARLAEAIRQACLDAALAAYEDAGISGLCEEGRFEIAVQAIKTLDLDKVIAQATAEANTPARREKK